LVLTDVSSREKGNKKELLEKRENVHSLFYFYKMARVSIKRQMHKMSISSEYFTISEMQVQINISSDL
jgi:hypothetical protein